MCVCSVSNIIRSEENETNLKNYKTTRFNEKVCCFRLLHVRINEKICMYRKCDGIFTDKGEDYK